MSLTSRLQALLDYANNKTEKGDTTLGEAVKTLVDGYGSGGNQFKYGGKNATLIDEYEEEWSLADTSFVIGSTSPTSATTIKSGVSNRYTGAKYDFGNKDVIVVQSVYCKPTYSADAVDKSKEISFALVSAGSFSMRKTSDTSAKVSRQIITSGSYLLKYYASGGTVSRVSQTLGLYMSVSAPTFYNVTASNSYVRCNSPALMCRASSNYMSTENMKKVIDCKYYWNVKVYTVDSFSTITSQINDDIDNLLTNGWE